MPNHFNTLPLPAEQLANLNTLGYHAMTPIQAAALPLALAGKDLIAQAKTGSGKTAAFSLSLLNRLNQRHFATQALVICPTRELATQVGNEIRRLARYRQNTKVVILCGGQAIGPQIGSLEHGAHIVVGTPGRLRDHLRKNTLNLQQIKTLVLDEADRMLEMGFSDDIEDIIRHTPDSRQTLLFSATYPDDILALSARFQQQPEQVSVASTHSNEYIEQQFFICQKPNRLNGLVTLLSHFRPANAVVFCNTKQQVRDVTQHLLDANISALALHGDMEQRDRDQVLIQFRQQSCRILVATDVAARGLDIDDLPAVINAELPRQADVYVHRIGRTGRAGKKGLALSLFTDSERYKLDSIGDNQQRDIPFEAIETLSDNHAPLPPASFVTLCIAGGRKEKVRPGDILGALTGDVGIDGKAVGNITIMDHTAYVAVDRSVANKALGQLLNGKIKGRKFKVRRL